MASASSSTKQPAPTQLEKATVEGQFEHARPSSQENVNARLENPLFGFTHDELRTMAETFCREHDLKDIEDDVRKGAILAQDSARYERYEFLTEDEREALRVDRDHKWKQPFMLYYMIVLCSVAAAVQGMDESVINGAQLFYPKQFGVGSGSTHDSLIVGFINSAPYLCCAVLGCWLTDPLNRRFGRRGAVFITATLSFLTCIWQGVTNSWPHLWAARFVLGLGIGPKSATVPVYAAECAPARIRGALVMQWQVWTAFGIMMGNVMDLAFYPVHDRHNITGLRWRLMLGSAGIPALVLLIQVFFCPESPRWLLSKGRYRQAYESLLRLRNHKILAARDLFHIQALLEMEKAIETGRFRVLELFTVPRNRRASLAAFIVMFGQQFCGINVIAYYSSTVFSNAGFSNTSALAASVGFGALNFLFAFPGFLTIDRFGRRNLLLVTFPLMSLFLLMTGFAFWIPGDTSTGRVAVVAIGIYMFTICYSPGEGPVPFTYSAEAFPLYVRELGMSFATAVCWGFNFILSFTWPLLLKAFKPQGAFGWYAAWCMILWLLILMFVPETKSLTLEELDAVFSVPSRTHAAYGLRQIPYVIERYILRRDVHPEDIYGFDIKAATQRRHSESEKEKEPVV
ncbi:hypothetical protein PUNSTDRAFT_142156 [Punctularia strigosozonata HHB-11173 SS5]|uniref:uncharacterized protein n=1 Tax=Punctularia strigosozonata (strain HHB-11173) TaxID=741275 RepID=UPI00044181FF|nr:uncharacterized protein PUNSTDRAFT_142156 [Punctularia strigosozonata HHB-11173 SS5]EIN11957.1 hypothetical protein PUNSTDRAFT_142156 [Punctularia strigosozonata HHB-11173 SS5]